MRCEECMALAEEYFEGGIDEQSEARVASHLSSCASCDAEHKLMLREQAAYSRFLLNVEPSPALWENLRAGIERERADTARADAQTEGGASGLGRFFAGLFAAPRRAAAFGFAAALVFVALATLAVMWRSAPDEIAANAPRAAQTNAGGDVSAAKNNPPTPPADAPASATVTTPAPAPPRVGPEEILKASALKGGGPEGARAARRATRAAAYASAGSASDESVRAWLREVTRDDAAGGGSAPAAFVSSSLDASDLSRESDVSRHAERVEVALRSFLNSNATKRRNVDVSYEKRQSRELLLRNVLLRQEARGEGDLPREELLARVEPVLIDIANLPAEASAEDVRQIKEHLRKKGIVSALRLYSAGGSARAF